MRIPTAPSSAAWMVLCATLLSMGCGGPTVSEDPSLATGGDNLGGAASEVPLADGGTAPDGRVTICHIPPGNPANAHSITVGAPAATAHLRHGDRLGACDGEEPTSDGGTSEPDGGSTTDGGSSGDVDAGPGPVCIPEGGECSTESETACCDSLSCLEGQCWPTVG
ncbi:hypothetical protein JYK02_30185 [Corallococcus macrosporus]|uniref:Lipoprotein n=1 Tax=Corallococcus macrosporus TaxID=35 RepID=A0ABS3DKE0_9BACT|nr:hypothetical protein [Corallococcus macrosporus]MBN8231789.1 hypothetical protein [Corallococcus macrosporus]